jgi:hypothetical protein
MVRRAHRQDGRRKRGNGVSPRNARSPGLRVVQRGDSEAPPIRVTPSPTEFELVRNLWRAPERYSRNRNFALYDDVSGRRALRWYRQLRSLKHDIGTGSQLRVQRDAHTAAVTIELDAISGRRRSRLAIELFELLLDDVEVGPRLRAALAARSASG